MNKMLSKLLTSILITAMLLGVMPMIMQARASILPPSFYVVPVSESFTTAGTPLYTTFNVTVWGAAINGTDAWSVQLGFNSSQLQVCNATFEAGPTSSLFALHAANVTGVTPVIDNLSPTGSVLIGEVLSGTDFIPATTAKLFTIAFNITLAPAPGQTLTDSLDPGYGISLAETFYLLQTPTIDYPTGSIDNPNTQACAYSYQWTPPPNPTPNVYNETTNTFTMFTNWVGTTFVEDVVIDGMSAAWGITNATTNLLYNGTLLIVDNVVFDGLWTGSNAFVNNTGDLNLYVETPSPVNPTGDLTIAKVTFKIVDQGSVPPAAYGHHDDSLMTLSGTVLYSQYGSINGGTGIIPINPQSNIPLVMVYAYTTVLPPWLSVSSISLGPGPVVGQEFNITITLHNVNEAAQHLIGIQYRVQFNHTLLNVVGGVEGPFFQGFAAAEAAAGYPPDSFPPGTFFVAIPDDPDGIFGPNIVVGQMIYPNDTGYWNEPLPDGTGVIATITFKVMYQSYGEPNYCTSIDICDQSAIGLTDLVTQQIVDVSLADPINGTVCVSTNFPGRVIDVYGGAVNSGMVQLTGAPYLQFPTPYGGQGPNAMMDLVEDQSFVYFWANVTYNYWPVQSKNVGFEIQEPDGTVYNKFTAFTDTYGVAGVSFRMPWPCDPQQDQALIGVWNVTVTVQLADVSINDTMTFHYDYKVHIWKVTTDMFQYNHGDTVQITFTYGSHAGQSYPVLFVVSIVDNLSVTVGIATLSTTVSGATDCTYKNYTATLTITLPKWAYAGLATIYISVFNWEPSLGGVPIGPEYIGPIIAIQPY